MCCLGYCTIGTGRPSGCLAAWASRPKPSENACARCEGGRQDEGHPPFRAESPRISTSCTSRYRETLTHLLRRNRPNDVVRLAESDALDRVASSFRPHMIV